MNQLEDDLNPNESNDEPLQSDVMLVAKMGSNLKRNDDDLFWLTMLCLRCFDEKTF